MCECRTRLPHPFPSISTAFPQGWPVLSLWENHGWKPCCQKNSSVASGPYVSSNRRQPRCTLCSTTHWTTSKHWQNLKLALIRECPLPFLTLLLLFCGQREGRTEMQQPLLSSQCCNLEYTDFHTMSHHYDFWSQRWSSGSPAPSFANQADIIWTKYTIVRLSKAIHGVAPLGSEAQFVMQNPSKIATFYNSKNEWHSVNFFRSLHWLTVLSTAA